MQHFYYQNQVIKLKYIAIYFNLGIPTNLVNVVYYIQRMESKQNIYLYNS